MKDTQICHIMCQKRLDFRSLSSTKLYWDKVKVWDKAERFTQTSTTFSENDEKNIWY